MTLAEVVKALKAENVLMPSGTIYSSGTTTDVRVKAQYADESELSQIQVTNAKGAKIPITAVASIKRQDQRVTRYARVNGDDAVVMAIYKNSDANVVNTVDNVTKSWTNCARTIRTIPLPLPMNRLRISAIPCTIPCRPSSKACARQGWSCSSSSGAGDRRWPS